MEKTKISQLSSEDYILWEEWKRLMKTREGIEWKKDYMPLAFYLWLKKCHTQKNN